MGRTDVIILGGGIIGCALAEELARHGQRVVLVERGHVGAEASSAAAGILSAQMDLAQPGPLFDLCQAARRMYPRWIEHLQRRSGMSVGYHVDGILYVAMTSREEQVMKRRATWQRRLGLRVERWSRKQVQQHEPAVDGRVRCGFHFPTEAQVDNALLMHALAIACGKAGVQIREETTVRRLLLREGHIRGVETDQGRLEAPMVVNCLGSWASIGGAFGLSVPVEPARGQILVFHASRRLLCHTVMSEDAYAVQRRDGRILVGSTIEFVGYDKSLTLEGMHQILCGVRHMSRLLNDCTFVEAWAGFRPFTKDQLPLMGKTAIDGLYAAAGHFRHGILLAPITAHLIAQLILRGRAPMDLSAFDPMRRLPQDSS